MRENYADDSETVIAFLEDGRLFKADGQLLGDVRPGEGDWRDVIDAAGKPIITIGHDHLFNVETREAFAHLQLSETAA